VLRRRPSLADPLDIRRKPEIIIGAASSGDEQHGAVSGRKR
jgi:hypothetical protein